MEPAAPAVTAAPDDEEAGDEEAAGSQRAANGERRLAARVAGGLITQLRELMVKVRESPQRR